MQRAIQTTLSIEQRGKSDGFTLIEMIGVLAVMTVLVALLLPRVFEIMAESKANALVAAVKTYETAVVDYYADIGSLLPLDVSGVPAVENSGNSNNSRSLPARLTLDQSDPLNTGNNSWVKFKGPYLAKFSSTTPPGLGTTVRMPARTPEAYGTATTGSNRAWDLNDDANSDIPASANVVYVSFSDITLQDFERVDSILDKGFGGTATERQLRGRVKYDITTKEMLIYLMHG
ncbi:MAG: type II secretion system GspH family protein [Nitrospirales bacterium]|nr:prepilin-type N-terminal cleavage/methylation domain-containing protein [Nitrospira sp.]MDR4500539.1 type II secretion system GspH family protein [Nitrospirales bacterium]